MRDSSPYRHDIDGLRALAVLSVVAYHLHLPFITGGFVGVDVFFVISGYLITRILIKELSDDIYSISRFYVRRIRRILPLLFLVLTSVLIAGYFVYLPHEFELIGESAVATALFSSNILFWKTSDYFARSAELNPLLHTWSLAVEEQFYIVFPLLLSFSWRYRSWRKPLFITVFFLSLGLSLLTVHSFPTPTFYLLPTRAWELMAGSLIALGVLPGLKTHSLRNLAGVLGMAGIAYGVFILDKNSVFPGYNAVPTALGTALIIHAHTGSHSRTVLQSTLSFRPLAGIGLISYSLYLWHWPFIVFSEYWLTRELMIDEKTVLFIAMILVSTLSWWIVERPFRTPSFILFSGNYSKNFAVTAVAILAMVCVGAVVIAGNGWPGRIPASSLAYYSGAEDFSSHRRDCHSVRPPRIAVKDACIYGEPDNVRLLVWGDSHSVELADALGQKAAATERGVMLFSTSSCPPAIGFDSPDIADCMAVNEVYIQHASSSDAPENILLVAFYKPHMEYQPDAFFASMERTIERLVSSGKNVFTLLPVPVPQGDVPVSLAMHSMRGHELEDLNIPVETHARNYASAISFLNRMADTYDSQLVDPAAALCSESDCRIFEGASPLYTDAHHLSMAGARIVAAPLDNLLE